MPTAKGQCLCGKITMEIDDSLPAEAKSLCHCVRCNQWSGGPAKGAIIYALTATDDNKFSPVTITSGSDLLSSFCATGVVNRYFCRECGSHLFHYVPQIGKMIVFPGSWRDSALDVEPTQHYNYESAMVAMKDGRPKWMEFPWNSKQCDEL